MEQKRSTAVASAYALVTCLFFAWGFITSMGQPAGEQRLGAFTLAGVLLALLALVVYLTANYVLGLSGQ